MTGLARDFFHALPGTPGRAGERLAVTRQSAAVPGSAAAPPTAVLLHGAGNGSKERLRPLLGEFAGRGCDALAFDFSGHGDSSGRLRELSLRRRFEQAVAVIDAQVERAAPLVLVGFSMSGQTVADLAAHYGDRIAALALCAPGIYAAGAWELPFGQSDGPFTRLIRTPGSWRDSPALDALRAYTGRAVLAVPGTDAVIPAAVTDAVQDALTTRARFTRLELPDATTPSPPGCATTPPPAATWWPGCWTGRATAADAGHPGGVGCPVVGRAVSGCSA
ncbi:alpha/beta fold hydrolase [Streptomyces sp. NPDC048290]|uniref:alpha/beta hydrolase n=1 Tax=Streptomyces sp. NPDC048290 TaxID=3155811 RepID=UPI0034498D85